jgi:hypothetical protein
MKFQIECQWNVRWNVRIYVRWNARWNARMPNRILGKKSGRMPDRLLDKVLECMSDKCPHVYQNLCQIDSNRLSVCGDHSKKVIHDSSWWLYTKWTCQDSRWAGDESDEVRGSDHGKTRDSHFNLYWCTCKLIGYFDESYIEYTNRIAQIVTAGKRKAMCSFCSSWRHQLTMAGFVPHTVSRWRFSKREVGSWKT